MTYHNEADFCHAIKISVNCGNYIHDDFWIINGTREVKIVNRLLIVRSVTQGMC